MEKFIVYAECANHSNFVFVGDCEEGFIVLETAMQRSKIFLREETESVIELMKKCAIIDANTIKTRSINRETERVILNTLKKRVEKVVDSKKYDHIKRKPIMGKARHIWVVGNNGNNIFYTCPKCNCTKTSTVEGNLYFRNGEKFINATPECFY